jgi:hypothetical protein
MGSSAKGIDSAAERLDQAFYEAEMAASSEAGEIRPEVAITKIIEATRLLSWLEQSQSSGMKRNQARRMFFDNDGNFDSEAFINLIELIQESRDIQRIE